jgi:flagellar basal body-associated protein FliL
MPSRDKKECQKKPNVFIVMLIFFVVLLAVSGVISISYQYYKKYYNTDNTTANTPKQVVMTPESK